MAVVALAELNAARVICSSICIFFFHRGPKRFYNSKQGRLPGEAGRTVE